ncbi:hypothetical protein MM1S1540310_4978 [Mycobacteroides abscessus subsp. bolletii 1S-154-0310]|uniref:Uncharacterized protein n=1 Tax=Mycobacteroides abscessus 1948 TaxID=1299323 RepID=A0A829QMW2_9MYCO|nr:hypothetical protein MM1S1510930_5420 [Mycobacteroides abscessus subsp. bolletii 1S-151-0930]EIU72162.1 hypothetical protein MM1S1530915_4972 [Mycobacteroides abscessus subsp. bolletii 1S-153-0915]EIU72414.1 hypothetical protein MM1S1520914_0641 [Mycobacteroides abscessus subsp. bolletii 1S-152-0914]EIU76399.1 hypothetical protein MM1S1540310_4978 [Mycobacteroides abscessus subsp. bolletii 1S-154-0310]EIV30295.1 hypothetical protein MA3A0119R_0386 [Mycobacteroides abscessus 3A-0119-R]EIV437
MRQNLYTQTCFASFFRCHAQKILAAQQLERMFLLWCLIPV